MATEEMGLEIAEKEILNEIKARRREMLTYFATVIVVGMFFWLLSPGSAALALIFAFIYGIAAISLNFQEGQTGIVNFGVIAFVAVGAYGTSILTLMGWHWTIALLGGMILAGIVAYLFSLPTLKLREDYFAIVTITFGEIVRIIFQQEKWFVYPPEQSAYWGGTKGLNPRNQIADEMVVMFGTKKIRDTFNVIREALITLGLPPNITISIDFFGWYHFILPLRIADAFSLTSSEVRSLFFLIVVAIIALIVYGIFERFYNSPYGRLNKAVREDYLATETFGYDAYKQQLIAMAVGSMAAGLAGGLFAFHSATIAPTDFVPLYTFFIWTMIVVGGFANQRGSLLGGLFVMGSGIFVTLLQNQITSLFSSFMEPVIPFLIAEAIPFLGTSIMDFTLNLPFNIIWTVKVSIAFLLVTFILTAVLLILKYTTVLRNTRYHSILFMTDAFLLIITILPFLLTVIPLYPRLQFSGNEVTNISFVSLSTFFVGLNPLFARNIALGILLILFLLYRPEGIFKEKTIYTLNPLEELKRYLEWKKKEEERELEIPGSKGFRTMSDVVLQTEGVNKTFGGVTALKEVSIAVKKGPLIGIIGPNGSGKSTLFNVLSGIIEQDKNREGRITFDDQDITAKAAHERAQEGLGRTFQQTKLFRNMTVLENLLVAAPFQSGASLKNSLFKHSWLTQERELYRRAFQILDFLNLLRVWNNKASEISGGQQKLVALGRALMSESKLVLLDEPVAGVNPTLAKRVFEKIVQLQQQGKHHFVVIEHNMDVQLSFCDYIYVLNKGEVVAEGTPDEILNNKEVIEAYLGH